MDVEVCLDLLRFLHNEGKWEHELFEKPLHQELTNALCDIELDNTKKLLICTLLSTFDNADDTYERVRLFLKFQNFNFFSFL